MRKEKLVLVFGTYDLFHQGHLYFLKEAKKHGTLLAVVVARDKTVKEVKGKKPVHNEKQRLSQIKKIPFVDRAYLGNLADKYQVITEITPDIICLGYDQKIFTQGLKRRLQTLGLAPKIMRIKKAYKPDQFKSSLLRKSIKTPSSS